MTNVATLPAVQQIDTRYTQDVIPVLDTSKFEHMQRIATAIAQTSMVPESLRGIKKGDVLTEFPMQTVIANCFRVVNQAVRWGFDPFALIDHAYVVHGRLGWEGKIIHAVIETKTGVRLSYVFDDGQARNLGVTVSGTFSDEMTPRTIFGRVVDWHKGDKSPWAKEGDWKRQLRYRGAREWARAHAPAVMLGVYSDDELHGIAVLDVPSGQRAQRLRDVTVKSPAALPDIPDIPDEKPTDQTAEARDAIAQAISVEMLRHVRDAYDEADWETLSPIYDTKMDELSAKEAA